MVALPTGTVLGLIIVVAVIVGVWVIDTVLYRFRGERFPDIPTSVVTVVAGLTTVALLVSHRYGVAILSAVLTLLHGHQWSQQR